MYKYVPHGNLCTVATVARLCRFYRCCVHTLGALFVVHAVQWSKSWHAVAQFEQVTTILVGVTTRSDVSELSQRAMRYDISIRATCNGWAVRSERRQPRTVHPTHITSLTPLPNLCAQPTCTSVLHVAASAAAAARAMPDQRKPPARAQDESCSILYALSDDTLAGVLHAAQATKVLGQLASTSK